MKFATWNVNSVRARHDRLLAFLERHDPDVVCLQETKVVDDAFPMEAIGKAGYEVTVLGQKTYNGVAILARHAAQDVKRGFDDGTEDAEARLLTASVEGIRFVCVYVPNGRAVGSETYAYKLDWMARLVRFLEKDSTSRSPLAVLGDFNVAPADIDVHDPDALRDGILCSERERQAFENLKAWGLTDSFRSLYPDEAKFTWWDYRQLGFPKNHGLRIDHILLTQPLVERLVDVVVDRDERKGKGASDHAPVLAIID
jgi:exodeoxyribonuclease-3